MEREPAGPGAPHGDDPAGAPEPGEGTGPEAAETGESDHAGLSPEEEPTTTGTLFIMIFFLMALAGMWGIMYLTLLNR